MLALPLGLAAGSVSCTLDSLPAPQNSASGQESGVVELFLGTDFQPDSKTSLGSDIEGKFSGGLIAVYDSETGEIDSRLEIVPEDLGNTVLLRLPRDRTYDIYLVANLWYIDSSDGTAVPLSLPDNSAGLESFSYRLDGGEVDSDTGLYTGGGLRRENFSELSDWGIPMCWSIKDIDPVTTGRIEIRMQRLFSKVVLTVDHSGISGTDLEAFVNGSVHIRQTNCRLEPFNPLGARALSGEDIIPVGDCDATMDNALVKDYVFYVPENMQGELMPDNTSAAEKDIEGVEAACGNNGISALLTYLEFVGELKGGSSGLSGEITYRFFLGSNAETNFDIPRNTEMHVYLSFNPGSVFEPDWKIDSGDITDTRDFFLSGDLAGRLPEGKTIIVRRNRPATFNVNILLEEGGENMISSATLVTSDYEPTSLNDIAWTSDFWAAGHKAIDEPQRRILFLMLGVSVDYNDGQFTFTASEGGFNGMSVPISLTLFPGGKTITANIMLYPDIEVVEENGYDISDGFLVGQKRTLKINGMSEQKLYYAAVQPECGPDDKELSSVNRQWKTQNTAGAPFVSCVFDSDGEVVLPYEDPFAYSLQSFSQTGGLNLYAFYPNIFSTTAGTSAKSAEGKLYVCSTDIHNDGIIEIPLAIRMPDYEIGTITDMHRYFPFDGKEHAFDMKFFHPVGGQELSYPDFDPGLYDLLFSPEVEYVHRNAPADKWLENIVYSPVSNSMYLTRTSVNGDKLEEEISGHAWAGNMSLTTNQTTGLLPKRELNLYCYISVPSQPADAELKSSYFSNINPTYMQMSVTTDFEYMEFDPEYLEVSETGEYASYQSLKNPLNVMRGSGNIEVAEDLITYEFKGSEQPTVTPDGEPVPGALLAPYGKHTFTLTTTNRWDGRKCSRSFDINFIHTVSLYQYGIFGPQRYASVYFVTRLNAYYLNKYKDQLSWDEIQAMMKTLGTDEWNNHIKASYGYYINGKWGRSGDKMYYGPAEDFDVKFLDSSASVWTEELAKTVTETDGVLWLSGLGFHDGNGTYVSTTTSNPDYTGCSAFENMRLSTSIGGYIFRNSLTE